MDVLEEHFARLQAVVPHARFQRRGDGSALVSVSDVRLPEGWNASVTIVHFLVPLGYPGARPDSFWTDPALRLASGVLPANAQMNGNNPGDLGEVLWFSFHPSSWNPLRDDLLTYFNVVRTRFREAR
jgi:Prokaryotic E2 family E